MDELVKGVETDGIERAPGTGAALLAGRLGHSKVHLTFSRDAVMALLLSMVLNYGGSHFIGMSGPDIVVVATKSSSAELQVIIFRCVKETDMVSSYRIPKSVTNDLNQKLAKELNKNMNFNQPVLVVDVFRTEKSIDLPIYDVFGNEVSRSDNFDPKRLLYRCRTYKRTIHQVDHTLQRKKFRNFIYIPTLVHFECEISRHEDFFTLAGSVELDRRYLSGTSLVVTKYLQRQCHLARKLSSQSISFEHHNLFTWFLIGGTWNHQKYVQVVPQLIPNENGIEIESIAMSDLEASFRGEG